MIYRIEKGKIWFLKISTTCFIFLLLFFISSDRIINAEQVPSPEINTGGDLLVHVPGDLYSLDSQVAITETEKLIIRNVQEGLLDYDPNGQIVPLLASSLPKQVGANKWIISLRPGIFFHDGNELDADDVIATFKRLKDFSLTIATSEIFEKLIAIQAVDKYRIELTTDGQCLNVSDLLTRTELFPLSAKALEKYGHNYGKVILIGTGPFCFQSWQRNKHITLVKNWRYRDSRFPYLNSISFEFDNNPSSRVKSLSSLRTHVAFQITPDGAATLEKNRWIHLYHGAGRQIVQMYLNSDVPPFDKKAIRIALARGIDIDGLITTIFKGFATRADSCIPPWNWAHKNGYRPIEYDPEKARFILKMEGYDIQNSLRFSLLVNKDPFFLQQAQYIVDSLANISVVVNIVPLSKAELYDYIYGRNGKNRGEFQAALEDWEDLRYGRDPWQFTAELYASGSRYNKVRLSDMVLDNIFEEIRCCDTFSTRQELYFSAERRIVNSVSTVYLCFPHHIHAARSRVRNLRVNSLNEMNFKEVWLLR